MVPFRRLSQRGRRSPEEHRSPHEWNEERDTHIMSATFPIHPLSSMQAPFEESMLDATGETGYVPFQNPNKSVKRGISHTTAIGDTIPGANITRW
jgi:hypothetical protein